jgi:hypothetical protein
MALRRNERRLLGLAPEGETSGWLVRNHFVIGNVGTAVIKETKSSSSDVACRVASPDMYDEDALVQRQVIDARLFDADAEVDFLTAHLYLARADVGVQVVLVVAGNVRVVIVDPGSDALTLDELGTELVRHAVHRALARTTTLGPLGNVLKRPVLVLRDGEAEVFPKDTTEAGHEHSGGTGNANDGFGHRLAPSYETGWEYPSSYGKTDT